MSQNQPNQTQSPSVSTERDERGRFVPGNSGGPGNPHARQVALLRSVMLSALTEERMLELTLKLHELALEGSVQAARLLLSYAFGKPTEGVNPDQVDVEEWELGKKTAQMYSEVPLMIQPEPDFTLQLTRDIRVCATDKVKGELSEAAEQMKRDDLKKEQRRQKRRQKAQSKAKPSEQPPSPNGNPDSVPPSPNGDSEQEIPPEFVAFLEEEMRKYKETTQ